MNNFIQAKVSDQVQAMEPIEVQKETKDEVKKEENLIKNATVQLDRYNSELHVALSDGNLVGRVMRGDGFQYMWGGVRATHGVTKGKVRYSHGSTLWTTIYSTVGFSQPTRLTMVEVCIKKF